MEEYSALYFISANESNPEGELALNILISNIIEVATAHANSIGIGNPSMAHLGVGWVLSRLTVEMKRYPKCNTNYRLRTWVEDWNHHFSVRNFSIETEEGEILGYARSIWMVLNMKTHEHYGLSHLYLPQECVDRGRVCPIARQGKHPVILPFGSEIEEGSKNLVATSPDTLYRFQYNDIDFYRHVNTVRYLTLLLNRYSLEDFDRCFVSRLELSFLHEGSFGMEVAIRRHYDPENQDTASQNHDSSAQSQDVVEPEGITSFSIIDTAASRPILFSRFRLTAR